MDPWVSDCSETAEIGQLEELRHAEVTTSMGAGTRSLPTAFYDTHFWQHLLTCICCYGVHLPGYGFVLGRFTGAARLCIWR